MQAACLKMSKYLNISYISISFLANQYICVNIIVYFARTTAFFRSYAPKPAKCG